MALRFWFGASGAGKTTAVQNEIIARASKERDMDFLMIVPDQFTMQTQKQMVQRHPDGGILNIDVLSFSRLSHRIFEEVGKEEIPVLDDTGKCLILRKVMEECKTEIPVLSAGLRAGGFVEEVKSVISEFMQYDMTVEDVKKLAGFARERRPLSLKLEELAYLYDKFLEACNQRYLTSEGMLHMLCERMAYSKLLRRSVIVMDGFTGFTPIQNKVIEKLLIYAKEVNVTLVLDHRISPYQTEDATGLFYLTQKTVLTLQKLAMANNVPLGEDVLIRDDTVKRFRTNPQLAHLERMLFRNETKSYSSAEEMTSLEVIQAGSMQQECGLCCQKIFELIAEKGYRYRDIAIVVSDMNSYEEPLRNRFEKYGVPYFIDNTASLMQNPFVAFLRSMLAIVRNDFRYDDVFTFLRSDPSGLTREITDRLDNYVRAQGIRGYRMWSKAFVYPSRELSGKEEEFAVLNSVREAFAEKFRTLVSLAADSEQTAEIWCREVYAFCVREKMAERLRAMARKFEEQNDFAKAKEYEQIYRLIMQLLEQIVSLLGTEKITLQEFSEILDAGLMEIRVASLPQGVDLLMVGDIERTRLKEIKALFFLGVNDGKIPKDNRSGGLISDMEREFLLESGMELSPTPAMKMFIQQLYLYMNLTKPEEYLWLSFASVTAGGESLSPAYLIKSITQLFPTLSLKECVEERPILSLQDEKDVFSDLLQSYLTDELHLQEEKKELLFSLCRDLHAADEVWLKNALETAFTTYQPQVLGGELAKKLYGEILNCSISSLEKFAACQYAHFLSYGLCLREREEPSFAALDVGNLSHEILQHFGEELKAKNLSWAEIQDELMESIVEKVTTQVIGADQNAILREEKNKAFYTGQIQRILLRSIRTLRTQLSAGEFVPYDYERSFRKLYENSYLLKGKIDRIDLCSTDDEIMVKIIDYKTGSREFDITGLYYGLSLQLAVYMKQVLNALRTEKAPMQVTPAAMLFYRILDPRIKQSRALSEEEMEKAILETLNTKGVVCSRAGVVEKLDADFNGKSLVVPVTGNDAGVKESTNVINSNKFETLLSFSEQKAVQLAKEIMQGGVTCTPVAVAKQDACEYCPYKTSCGFDERIPGYRKEYKENVTLEELCREGGAADESEVHT